MLSTRGGRELKTITIQVEGLRCPSCEALVREAIEELEGVRSAEVSHVDGSAVIVYDEQTVSPEAFRTAVEQEGFRVAG